MPYILFPDKKHYGGCRTGCRKAFRHFGMLVSWCIITCCLSCMPEENLPIRNVGNAPEYFVECYCKPGEFFALAATSVLPVSENLQIDFSKEMAVTIRTDKDIKLVHTLYTLPGSDFIYNYGSDERMLTVGLDSLHLSITTEDGKTISGSTPVPSPVSIYDYDLENNEATIRFYTSEKVTENYYIYSAEVVCEDTIISREVCYLDLSEYHSGGLTGKSVHLTDIEKAQKILLTLKRITRANYEYQISLNAANTANQSSITTPVPLKGNLKGALGIFTCYTEDQVAFNPKAKY